MRADLTFYKVDRDEFLRIKPLEQRLSCHYLKYEYDPIEEFYKAGNKHILRSFHQLFNFITGEDSPSIIIDPETSTSFCSLGDNKIQVGTALFADHRFSQQQRVDAVYAIMLHEMWHKRYTNKALREKFNQPFYYGNQDVKLGITKILPTQLHINILNILEDYRIEKLGLREFPGYIFYFDALREYVLSFQQLKKVTGNHGQVLEEYLMFKILIPEMLPWFLEQVEEAYGKSKPSMTLNVLKGFMDKFDRYIADNQSLVYSDDFSHLLVAMEAIYQLFPADVRDNYGKRKVYSGIATEYGFDNPAPGAEEDGYINAIGEILGDLAKETEDIEKTAAQVRQGGSTDMKMRTEKINIMNVRDREYRDVEIYSPVARIFDQSLITESRTVSKHISRDLGFLASRLNQKIEYFELMEGELDEDELYAISFSKALFKEEESMPGFELDFGILLDESGSMAYRKDDGIQKIRKAVVACYGIASACIGTPYVNLFVYGHSNMRNRAEVFQGVELYEYVNTKRGIRDCRNILAAQGYGGNADGYAIAKMGEIMLRDSQAKQKVLVVISDGKPAAMGYNGIPAEKHVQDVVGMLDRKGIKVIQLCIDNIERSQYMFRHYIPYDPNGNFGKELRQIMQKYFHKFLESF